jgi:hypothetical protein
MGKRISASRAERVVWGATAGEDRVIRLPSFYRAGGGFRAGWVPLVIAEAGPNGAQSGGFAEFNSISLAQSCMLQRIAISATSISFLKKLRKL